jgi:hypothetical protein
MDVVATEFRTEKHIDLDKLIADLSTDKVLKVGWPKAIRYSKESGGNYIAEIAAQNEYGAPHKRIPARPFMGPAITNNKAKWLNTLERGVKSVIKGNNDIDEVLKLIGAQAAGDVSQAIKDVTSPQLSEVTIAIRLSKLKKKARTASLEKPLIDTGIMLRSVTYAVEKE